MDTNTKSPLPVMDTDRPHKKSARKKRRSMLTALILMFVIILSAAGYYYKQEENSSVANVSTVLARKGDIEVTVTALGNLQPRDYVDVGAQVSGQLEKLHVNIGDNVEAGELLAEIDPQVLLSRVEASRAQLQAQKAQLAELQAELELARQQYQRQENLLNDDATSKDAYQISLAAVKTKQAQIEALKAQIEETESSLKGDEATLGYTKIYAPISGTVVQLLARQGQTLNANLSAPVILRIADLSTMTVWTQVSEADVPKLKVGMDAYFSILGKPGQRWSGKLRQILPTPEIINNVVLYTALFDVANPDRELMTQMTAQVFFVIASAQDVITVPMSALRPIDDKAGRYDVTVVDNRNQQETREVKVGISNRVSAEIISGLKEGEKIIDTPPKNDAENKRRSPFRIF